MKESTSKEQILSKVRNALIEKSENPYQEVDFNAEIMNISTEEPDLEFASELIAAGGNFVYCENEGSFVEYLGQLIRERNWPIIWCGNAKIANLLDAGEISYQNNPYETENLIGVTSCEKLIARTGSILVSDIDAGSRKAFSLPDIHIVMAYTSQVTDSLKTALSDIKKKYDDLLPSQLTVITGASRTADIEKTLVKGAHGPKELFVFLIDDL